MERRKEQQEQMILQHITFTGVDIKTDIDRLKRIQEQYPLVEYGVLTSYHWYENGNRYLDPKHIGKLCDAGLNLSLHVCGSAAHDAAEGEWGKIDRLILGNLSYFKRCQLNISERKDNPIFCHPSKIVGQEVIIQQRNTDEIELYNRTKKIHSDTPSLVSKFTVLLDASGGRGLDTEIKVLSSPKTGYAGGFTPENVRSKLDYLLSYPTFGLFWIDMESGVRTDDWFDLDKVERVLKTCYNILK